MRYKVLKGKHDHYDVTYCEGEIIDTEMDLEAIFPNKFERVDREVPLATIKDKPLDETFPIKLPDPVDEDPVDEDDINEDPVDEEEEEEVE